MLDNLHNMIAQYHTHEEKYNHLREYLQWLLLKKIDEKGYFKNIAFLGGTALRILYDLRRFSEDLDFSLINNDQYNFENIISDLKKSLELENLEIYTNSKSNKAVGCAFIRFENILHQLGLTQHKDQKLMIKLEVDQNPPTGFQTQLSLINKVFLLSINHYDLPSLFAGKLHAVLYRKYTKGRDIYDLIWYITKGISPNYNLLNQAALQTDHVNPQFTPNKLINSLKDKINSFDYKSIKEDIRPFLEDQNEIRFFEKSVLFNLVEQI